MFGTDCNSLERDNEYLRDEIERRDREAREAEDREWARRDREKADRERARREALCYAGSWEEAFENGIIKFGIEAREEAKFEKEFPDMTHDRYFRDQLAIAERAQTLYLKTKADAQERIDAILKEVREQVAAELDKEFPDNGISVNLREDDYNALVGW